MSININNKEDKVYIVMGAPHSATSFVSKMLLDAGINMGRSLKQVYQSKAFTKLNDYILYKAGGYWYRPPKEERIDKVVELDNKIKQLINKSKSKFWGFKDPRTSFTAQKYLPHIEGDIYLICCFRKPDKVVQSFRHKIPESVDPQLYKDKNDKRVTRGLIDKYNRALIKQIKDFCDL